MASKRQYGSSLCPVGFTNEFNNLEK